MKARQTLAGAALLVLLCHPAGWSESSESPVSPQAYAHYQRGMTYFKERNYAAAAPEFAAAAELSPNFGQAYFRLGDCEVMQNENSAAIPNFQKALAASRDTKLLSMIHYDLGIAYLKTGKKPLADQQYQEAVRLNPEFAKRPLVLAPPAAVTAPGANVKGAPEALAHYQKGAILAKEGNYPKACQEFETAIHLDPIFGQAILSNATCLDWKGQHEAARRGYQTAITAGLFPELLAYAHASLGTNFLSARDDFEAAREFQTAADLYAPINPDRRAECLRLLKQAQTTGEGQRAVPWVTLVLLGIVVYLSWFIYAHHPAKKPQTAEPAPAPESA